MKALPLEVFEELVADALDEVPPELMELVDNVVFLVEDRNPEEPELLGLYEGHSLTERGWQLYGTTIRESNLVEADLMRGLTSRQVDELAHLLEKLLAGLDDSRL